jgi:hypothetical protein
LALTGKHHGYAEGETFDYSAVAAVVDEDVDLLG